MTMHRPFVEINLFALVSREYAVIFPTVCEVAKGIQDAIVETADCVVVLDDFRMVARKMSALLTKMHKKGT